MHVDILVDWLFENLEFHLICSIQLCLFKSCRRIENMCVKNCCSHYVVTKKFVNAFWEFIVQWWNDHHCLNIKCFKYICFVCVNGIWQVNKNNNHFVYVWHVLYENFGVDWISVLFLFGSSVCWINVCVVANMELIGNNMLIFILNNLF